MPKKVFIYLASPYSASTPEGVQANLDRTIEVANQLIDIGYLVFVPNLNHYFHVKKERSWEFWMQQDLMWLPEFDALYYTAPSKGVNIELEKAKEHKLKILSSLDEAKKFYEEKTKQ